MRLIIIMIINYDGNSDNKIRTMIAAIHIFAIVNNPLVSYDT